VEGAISFERVTFVLSSGRTWCGVTQQTYVGRKFLKGITKYGTGASASASDPNQSRHFDYAHGFLLPTKLWETIPPSLSQSCSIIIACGMFLSSDLFLTEYLLRMHFSLEACDQTR